MNLYRNVKQIGTLPLIRDTLFLIHVFPYDEILLILFFQGKIRIHEISTFIEKNIHTKEGVPI